MRVIRILLLLILILSNQLGLFACGGSGGTNGNSHVASIEITVVENSLLPGETLQIMVTARDAAGNILGNVTVSFEVDFLEYASVDPQGLVEAFYPGPVQILARSNGVTSNTLTITVTPPQNNGIVTQITTNTLSDDWGDNNFWKMIARGVVLWRQIDGNGDAQILTHDVVDPVGVNDTIDTVPMPNNGIDFMALGSGGDQSDLMASWRVDTANTMVSEDGQAPVDLGDQNQEENSIANGCFYFREGGGFDDIQLFTFVNGLQELASIGELHGPIGSLCQTIWEKRINATNSEIVFYNGQSMTTIIGGLPNFPQYDFRQGIIVFSKDGDIAMVDTRLGPPFTVLPISDDGLTINDTNPKTDGNSIVWRSVNGNDEDIMLYDLASQTKVTISNNTDPKTPLSIQIDVKQVIWLETVNNVTSLFFHDGSGEAAGTAAVTLGGVPIDNGFLPYLANGIVTWIGNDGDTEVFIME